MCALALWAGYGLNKQEEHGSVECSALVYCLIHDYHINDSLT